MAAESRGENGLEFGSNLDKVGAEADDDSDGIIKGRQVPP